MCNNFRHNMLLRRKFLEWREYILLEKVEAARKNQRAALLGDRNLVRCVFQRWTNVTKIQKMERRIEAEVAAKWVKVRQWLKDAQVL
jgi:hypothetical protein